MAPKSKGIFRNQSNIYDGDFSKNNSRINCFRKKTPSQTFDWLLKPLWRVAWKTRGTKISCSIVTEEEMGNTK